LAEHAIVAEEKIRDYHFNRGRPVGGAKAIEFASIGYTRDNWQERVDDLARLATTADNFVAKSSFSMLPGTGGGRDRRAT
jgi:hypothetical protein